MKNIGLALSSLVLIFICFDTATACWCRRVTLYTEEEFREAVADELRHRDVVFSGEVIEVSQSQIKFKVAKVWKGEAAEEITLSSMYYVKEKGETFIECSYSFEVGKSYLVYAELFESLLQVHECSRTQLLNKAARDMEALNKLKAQGLRSRATFCRPDSSGLVDADIRVDSLFSWRYQQGERHVESR